MDKKPSVLKICLVTVTLSDGGAERVAALLSNYFDNQEFEVYHVVFSGKVEYDFSGKIFHLEHLKDKRNSWWSRSKRFFALKKFFATNHFDYVIDFRTKEFFLQELIIHNFIYPKFIQTIHSFKLKSYLPKNTFLAKLLYKNCQHFITVSNGINDKVSSKYKFIPSQILYNPIDFENISEKANEPISDDFQYVLSAGSMNKNVKQFDKLIECYAKSVLPSKNIKLLILGEGKLKNKWIKLVESLNLQDLVIFKGNVKNPFRYYKNALFTISSSKYEGMPMVLLESLACKTPIISWDYTSGPSEIISHKNNGLLVENQNSEKLIEAINLFVSDNNLYLHCKDSALTSVKQFSLETIGAEWLKVFEKQRT
ncbi:glycosyltransferase [Flavobacterium terrigena]|uniref:N-acetylgalactosamine-N,N'-diacetylbacillosaminyl-diphospho-undecaprenol 4-alpha-N-acetylgalactosaminyltransferase n=1 Tax=Flavobacterium terrigena TaxID=402734 RepID=A0A1H6Y1E0_9FLAO|nr:glycosyltransferase [Flavobacterium terrigena]SEJ30930.1 N-acetylgalactosamine-N,N'-diacetylbacillosaminyl-diphospho-undecaprenol 4-alpha-N-acetylgalactosaminyltransferase [Flavobacterium terrigena]